MPWPLTAPQTLVQATPPASGTESLSASTVRARLARTLLLGVWFLVVLIHLLLLPERRQSVWLPSYLLLQVLATSSLAYRAWRERGVGRLAWWLLTASAFLDALSIAVWIHSILGGSPVWEAGLIRVLGLAAGLLVLTGILNFPQERTWTGADRRRILDGLLFAASVLFLLWVVGVHGTLRLSGEGLGFRILSAYLQAALLGGGLVYMTSGQAHRFRGPLGWLWASALAWLVVLSSWALTGFPLFPETLGWWPLVGCIPLCQALAAWSPTPLAASAKVSTGLKKAVDLVPYFPVGLALGVLAVLLLQMTRYPLFRGAAGIFLVMVVLLLLRQLQAIHDLQTARHTLEERVRERTQALELAQNTLMRTERMNTAALMGAGLAHDLNNLLCVMKSSTDLALLNLEQGGQSLRADLDRIASSADRASRLTSRLMGFVRQEEEPQVPMDLGREMEDMEATLRLILPRSVRLVIIPPEGEMTVRSSKRRLEQMLVNLVANAGDAMPAGGTLRILAGPAVLDLGYAMLEVSDSGTGMSAETLARIFDPFFTTKPPGKGTGLGLPSLKAMVEEDGGRMEVHSEPGMGSRFRIFLPRVSPR